MQFRRLYGHVNWASTCSIFHPYPVLMRSVSILFDLIEVPSRSGIATPLFSRALRTRYL
jgi:hypothetical protein